MLLTSHASRGLVPRLAWFVNGMEHTLLFSLFFIQKSCWFCLFFTFFFKQKKRKQTPLFFNIFFIQKKNNPQKNLQPLPPQKKKKRKKPPFPPPSNKPRKYITSLSPSCFPLTFAAVLTKGEQLTILSLPLSKPAIGQTFSLFRIIVFSLEKKKKTLVRNPYVQQCTLP